MARPPVDAAAPQPLPQQTATDAQTVATIVSLILVGATTALLAPKIAAVLRPLGISGEASALAVRIAMAAPVSSRQAQRLDTPGVQATVFTEPTFRATYILQAARRIQQGLREKRPLQEIVQQERRWFERHRIAADRRFEMAQRVDVAVDRYGPIVGWYSKIDSRTTPECRAANGKNFDARQRPTIGYPGTVHPNCRCRPGPPHRGAKLLAARPAKRAAS